MAGVRKGSGGGLRHMVLAAFFFSLMSLLVRLAGERLPSSMIVLARAVVALVLSYVLVRRAGLDPWGRHRGLLLLRGLFGFGALTCFYWALTRLPLAEATVIQYTNPIFTALLAALVLREHMRGVEIFGVALSLVGVVLVAKPGFLFLDEGVPPLDPVAVGIALLGAILSAAAYVAVRKAHGAEPALVVVFWFPLVATPLSIPPAIMGWIWPTPREWLLLLGVGITTQIAQVFMTEGLHREPAGRATAMSYLQIVFAAIWGVVFLSEVPDLLTVAGGLLIGVGVLALAAWPRSPVVEGT